MQRLYKVTRGQLRVDNPLVGHILTKFIQIQKDCPEHILECFLLAEVTLSILTKKVYGN